MNRPAILILLCVSAIASRAQDAPIRQQIEASEHAVAKAFATKDYAALEKLWSPQMIVNSPGNGVLTRDQVFAAIRIDQLNYAKYDNTVDGFQVFGDIAVLMGHEHLTPATGPEAGTILYRRFTDIWQRTNGSWLQIARQATYTEESKAHYNNPK
jgi:ketosteroid isomerase-like protein